MYPISFAKFEATFNRLNDFSHPYEIIPSWVFIVLLAIGFLGHIVNVFVYSRPSMRTPINYLLCSLELVNVFLLATFIPTLVFYHRSDLKLSLSHVVDDIGQRVATISVMCCSNCLTVCVGVFRYVAISCPLKAKNWCSKTRTKLAIAGIVVASVIITSPEAFVYSIQRADFNVTYPDDHFEIRSIYFRKFSLIVDGNPSLQKVAAQLIVVVTSIVCFCLAFVIMLLLLGLWKTKRNRDRMMNLAPYSVGQQRFMIPFNKQVQSEQLSENRLTIGVIILVFLSFSAYFPLAVFRVMILSRESYSDFIKNNDFCKVLQTGISILVVNGLTFFIYALTNKRYQETLFQSMSLTKSKEITTASSFSYVTSTNAESVTEVSLGLDHSLSDPNVFLDNSEFH